MKRFENFLGYIPPSASEGTDLNWCGQIAQYTHSESEVPVLVAKRKNGSLGFLKQLLGLNS